MNDGKLELSLRSYLDAVLANNTDIQISRLTVEQPRNAILRAYSIFDPSILSSFTPSRNARPVATRIIGDQQQLGADIASSLTQQFVLRGQQMLPTGTTYSVGYDANRFTSTSTDGSGRRSAPQIQGNLAFNITQPLLRNRGTYFTKLPITIARGRLKSSEFNIQDQILRVIANAENAYWDVVSARENLRVQEQALALFGESLKRSQRELELGALSELEIFQPRAQYANAEIQVTQAKFRLQQTEDALRRQISADLNPAIRELPIVLDRRRRSAGANRHRSRRADQQGDCTPSRRAGEPPEYRYHRPADCTGDQRPQARSSPDGQLWIVRTQCLLLARRERARECWTGRIHRPDLRMVVPRVWHGSFAESASP